MSSPWARHWQVAPESVKEGADVASGGPGEPLGPESGDDVEANAGGVAGAGVLPYLLGRDAVEAVRQIRADGAARCRSSPSGQRRGWLPGGPQAGGRWPGTFSVRQADGAAAGLE